MIKPKIRFDNNYPEWEVVKVEDIIDYERPDKYIVKSDGYCDFGVPVLTANKSFILGFTDENEGVYEGTSAIIFDDFTCDSKYVDFPFKVKSSAIKILSSKDDNKTSLKFFYECLNSKAYKPKGHQRHWIGIVQKQELAIPCYQEQQKIAAFFTALDEKIRLSEQKLNLISKIKKGIAQKLFAQDLRFKNKDGYFFDSWKSYTVGELVDVIGGGTPSTQNPDYWDGDIYWLTPTEINSKYVHSSNRKITFDGVKNSSAKLLPKGALLLTTRATLGACSINNQDNPVCTNQGFQSLVCKDGVDNEFMYYVVTDSAFQKAMIQRASGSTFLEISSKNLKGILIHLPSLEEQRQIATLLSSLDKKIDCLKQRVKALKTQKASFMQQMFV